MAGRNPFLVTDLSSIEANASFRFFETFLVVGTNYLLMVSILQAVLHTVQRGWRRSRVGLGV